MQDKFEFYFRTLCMQHQRQRYL